MSERIYGVATKAWQVVAGCDERMPCAAKCWAKNTVNRLAHSPNEKTGRFHRGLVREFHDCDDPQCGRKEHNVTRWTGTVKLNESHLTDPLRWRKPAAISVGYHGDLFRLPHEQIDRVFAVMALCPQHVFLTLTKCAKEMAEYLSRDPEDRLDDICHGLPGSLDETWHYPAQWPLPNLFLGFSASNQSEFDARAPHVLKLAEQGWKTWVSIEPMIGPVDVSRVLPTISWDGDCTLCGFVDSQTGHANRCQSPHLSQVVLGGESGKDARPCHPDWVRSVRDQCAAAGVPFHFKQWGEWRSMIDAELPVIGGNAVLVSADERKAIASGCYHMRHQLESMLHDPMYSWQCPVIRVGKKLAGRTLGGRTHDELAWEVENR